MSADLVVCPRCDGSGWTVMRPFKSWLDHPVTEEEYPSVLGAGNARTCSFCHGVGTL